MTTAIATTGSSFTGADVDGLDKLAQEFTQAAQVCDEVKMACEVIVAAASFFGPFGAAFVAYLKGTVIPWLTKISQALTLMAKVLSMHSQAQKDASSTATSLPSYQTPANLPQTSTQNYPTLPVSAAPSAAATAGASPAPVAGSSTVSTPPSIGGTGTGTTAGGAATGHTATGAGAATPQVAAITALTGLVTAVDHLIHPTSATTATGAVPVTGTPTTITGSPTTISGTPTTVDGSAAGLGGTSGLVPGGSGGSGGIDLSSLQPLHPGDSIGVVSVPVDISPSGQITPLIHTPTIASGIPVAPTTPAVAAVAAHALSQPIAASAAPAHIASPVTGSGAGVGDAEVSGGGSAGGFGAGSSGAAIPSVTPAHPAIASHPAILASDTHAIAHHPAATAGSLSASAGPGATHDGLYSGLGQATGLGAGGAALARATLHEARQRAQGGLLGAMTLPFDSGADGAAQAHIFDGELR